MSDALIGATGFVGGNLLRNRSFDALYHSRNIDEIVGRRFDTVICAGMPAAKWIANRDPDADRSTLDKLTAALERVEAKRFVLVSTVDVYGTPAGCNEATPIDRRSLHPYGLHRLQLEDFIRARFADALILRLPALFGPGLKKNAVYDLLHDNNVAQINGDSRFQFYDVTQLHDDIDRFSRAGIDLINVAVEPTSMREVARECFGFEFSHPTATPAASYDIRTLHAIRLGGGNGYLQAADVVLDRLRSFVRAERTARP